MSANRYQFFSSGLAQLGSELSTQYTAAKNWVAKVSESDNALRLKGGLNGVKQATLGVYYIFDLGLAVIPATSMAYNVVKGVKYAVTGVTFGVSAYFSYQKNKTSKNVRQKVLCLKEKLKEMKNISADVKAIEKKADDILIAAGYGSQVDRSQVDRKIAPLEIEEAKPELSQSSSLAEPPCIDSKPVVGLRSLLNGMVTASGVHYLFDLGSEFIKTTSSYNTVSNVFIGSTLLISAAGNYDETIHTIEALKELKELEIQIDKALAEMEKDINKVIGTPENIASLAKYSSAQTKGAVQIVIRDGTDMLLTPPAPTQVELFLETKPVIGVRSFINGSMKASGMHYLFQIMLPTVPAAKYVAGLSTLAVATYRAYKKILDTNDYNASTDKITQKTAEKQNSITMGKDILRLQEKNLAFYLERSDEIEREEEEFKEANDIKSLELAEDPAPVPSSPPSEVDLEKGLGMDSSEIELSQLPAPHFFSLKNPARQSDRAPLLKQEKGGYETFGGKP